MQANLPAAAQIVQPIKNANAASNIRGNGSEFAIELSAGGASIISDSPISGTSF